MVEGEGFEPSKAEPTDLQSVPFDRSGTPPTGKAGIVSESPINVNHVNYKFGIIFRQIKKPLHPVLAKAGEPNSVSIQEATDGKPNETQVSWSLPLPSPATPAHPHC